MAKDYIMLLTLNLFVMFGVLYASSVEQLTKESTDAFAAIKKAAQILSVSSPANWADYMNASVTNGTQGAAQVGSLTLNNTMANWSIPEQFLSQAIQSVKSFLSDAKKESYTVEVFMFNTPSGGALSTLLVAIKEIDKPIDSYSTVTVEYVTINTNAGLKPVYRISNRCFTCSDCFWFWECCCKNDEHVEQRSNTPEELNIIKQKMTADQFTWFNQKIVPST